MQDYENMKKKVAKLEMKIINLKADHEKAIKAEQKKA